MCSPRKWEGSSEGRGGMPEFGRLKEWVRFLSGSAQALYVPEAKGLETFHLLRYVPFCSS